MNNNKMKTIFAQNNANALGTLLNELTGENYKVKLDNNNMEFCKDKKIIKINEAELVKAEGVPLDILSNFLNVALGRLNKTQEMLSLMCC